jgi:amiloride-sensitive sodium channel
LWWGLVFLICFFGCGRLIFNIYQKWDTTPVIVSFAEKSTPVWQIPFPAVTICPETKARMELFNFTARFHNLFENASDYE